jgi:hypothetical protein
MEAIPISLGENCMKSYLLIAISLIGATATAQADVKYSETMKTADGESTTSTTTFIKAGAQRVETSIKAGPVTIIDATITVCETRRTYRLDPKLKIYTSSPLDDSANSVAKTSTAKTDVAKEKAATGKMTSTFTVKFLGVGEVTGRKVRHYLITQRMQSQGCIGNSDTTMKSEIWVTDYNMPTFDCGSQYGGWSKSGSGDGGCKVEYEQKGDFQAYQNAYKGLIVRRKMFMGADEKNAMTWEVTSLSNAKLDDALFSVPTGWKQVSDKEYDEQRQKAMIAAMMGGQNTHSGNAGATGDDESPQGDSPTSSPRDNVEAEKDEGNKPEGGETKTPDKKESVKDKIRGRFKLPF